MFSDGGYDITLAEGENHADIPLTRMMARVDFNIDTGSLERPYAFSVRSVTIFSPVDAYTPFDGDVRKEGDADSAPGFDSASARDISLLNNGGTIRLYAFENMQGTLLPGNTDPWKKVPSSIGDNAPLCTYIEAVCSYTTDTETCDDITYRMYLGENATTNFDVRRNTLYRLTLEPTEGEIRGKRGSWKIETGEWEDIAEVGLVLTPSRMELEVGETGTVSSCFVLTWPDGRCETLSAYSDWAVEGMGYRHVQLMGRAKQEPSMELKGRSPGYATVTATAEYDGVKYDAEMEVEVVHGNIGPVYTTEYEYELVVSPDSATLAEGETVSFTATYITREYILADGVRVSDVPSSTTEDDVTEMANWTVRSGARYVTYRGTGVFGWASGPGTAVIEATFNGCSDTAEINTLAHDIEYSSEYEYELVVNPDSATLAEGETVSFTATYITREYALEDGIRVSSTPVSTTEDDVTGLAVWSVRSGARYVTDRGTGVFGWASGPGTAAIEASFNNCSDTAEVNTLAHEIEYSSEYEYELVVSPSSATLEEGGAVSFTATYITREYALEDGIRVSSAPVSTTEDDVTGLAVWSVRSGTRYISNEGTGVFGWVSGPGTAVIEASYGGCSDTAEINASEPDPVPSLTASVSVQDTWGGNEYPVTLTYDDGRGHLTDVSSLAACTQLDFTGGIPSGLLEWDGGHIVAEDWWGMSGAWVTSSPAYSMTLSYEGLSVEISGTMHGFTGAEISLGKDVWHYREVEDNGWSTPPVTIMLTGSERLEVTDGIRYVDSDYVLGNGYIGLGTGIPLYVEFTDPSNGYGRSGSTEFDVITNVVSLHAYINVYFMSGASGETVSISNASTVSGAFFGVVGITGITDGYPPYGLVVQQSIWYVDYRGETHSVTSQYGQDDDADDISISDEWSLENQWDASIRRGETHLIGIDVNGFSASWQWGYVGG